MIIDQQRERLADLRRQSAEFWRRPEPHNRKPAGGLDALKRRQARRHRLRTALLERESFGDPLLE